MKSGQSTKGYGKSKVLVLEAHARGLTVSQIAKETGLSYSSVYNVCRRARIKLHLSPNRRGHGEVKNIVLTEHFQNGLTPVQIIRKYNFSSESVYSVYRYCGFKYHK